jgi:hypothetical protein
MRNSSGTKARPNIVSVQLSPEAKDNLDRVCDQRGMTIKTLLGRLIGFFVELDKTEQSVLLGQVEAVDMPHLSQIILKRAGVSSVDAPKRPRKVAAPR